MNYATLGRSNLKVSRVCLGTMHFGVYTSKEDSFAIMDKCLELGLNFFDTANVYGRENRGRTEEIIGQWFALGEGRREAVVLATKVYGAMTPDAPVNEQAGISSYKIRKHLADSLKRLQTDHIDLYQVHHIDRAISLEEFWGTFERFMAQGDILYVGSSNFPGWGLAKFQMSAWQRGHVGLISEQTMYNLLCRYPELELLPAAKDMGIGVIPYMPLAGGLLSGKRKSQEGSRTAQVENEYGFDVAQDKMFEAFSTLCAELGEKEHIVATAWTLHNEAVTSAIVGVRTLAHLENIERAAELRLEPAVLAKLDTIFDINKGRPLRIKPAPEAYAW
jgi:aryl-alcohol dehydrogenase-like predicted oxidoreductase